LRSVALGRALELYKVGIAERDCSQWLRARGDCGQGLWAGAVGRCCGQVLWAGAVGRCCGQVLCADAVDTYYKVSGSNNFL
jgi:hypothetical protein